MDLLRCTNYYCTTKTRLNKRSTLGALATSDQLWRWGAYNAACRTISLFAQGSHKTTTVRVFKKKMLAKWPSVPQNLAGDTFLKCYTVCILEFHFFDPKDANLTSPTKNPLSPASQRISPAVTALPRCPAPEAGCPKLRCRLTSTTTSPGFRVVIHEENHGYFY